MFRRILRLEAQVLAQSKPRLSVVPSSGSCGETSPYVGDFSDGFLQTNHSIHPFKHIDLKIDMPLGPYTSEIINAQRERWVTGDGDPDDDTNWVRRRPAYHRITKLGKADIPGRRFGIPHQQKLTASLRYAPRKHSLPHRGLKAIMLTSFPDSFGFPTAPLASSCVRAAIHGAGDGIPLTSPFRARFGLSGIVWASHGL